MTWKDTQQIPKSGELQERKGIRSRIKSEGDKNQI